MPQSPKALNDPDQESEDDEHGGALAKAFKALEGELDQAEGPEASLCGREDDPDTNDALRD